jgi:hypothetical protein
MKVIKNLFALILFLIGMAMLIGFIHPIFFTDHQQWYQGFVGILSAFIGSGLIFGFKGYATNPRRIGNIDEMPIINQTWIFFFIGCIANLLWATLYV